MNQKLQQLLQEIEGDMGMDTAAEFARVASQYFNDSSKTDRQVSAGADPTALLARLPPLDPNGKAVSEVVAALGRDIVAESNWLYHPRYMGHQVTAPLPIAVWAEPVIAALNQSIAVREMSPAATVIEKQIIDWMAGLAGLGAKAGGTFTSGGTEATFAALLAARANALPSAWEEGVAGALPVVLCGEHAHYAVTRAVAQLGLGLRRVITIATRDYRMDTGDLAAKLAELKRSNTAVMAVVATAGSTATGSFDDLRTAGALCRQYGIWFHVDGAHGASALLSNNRRHLLAGIESARSIAWDAHKMMLMPLSVGALIVRDEADLTAAFRQRAPYLFGESESTRSWDQGSRSFQCSRRADVVKLWVALQRYGTEAFGLLFDYFSDLALELHAILAAHPEFELLHTPDCNILCFRYVGTSGMGENRLNDLNLALREDYNSNGTGWITSTVLGGVRVLRTTLMNPRIRSEHLRQLVTELADRGKRLANVAAAGPVPM